MPVESLDRAQSGESRVDSDGPISCGAIDLARARAYEERCEDSFREYTLNDRIEQDCCALSVGRV